MFLKFANRLGLAAMLMVASVFMAHAQIQRPVSGVVAAATSPVTVNYTEADGSVIGRVASVGDPIYLDDEIVTGADTNMQILLKDQTVFTIGPNSVLVFDTFIYDPANAATESSLTATVKKGTFKFISGRISKSGPEAMKLKVANATASIRGTSVAGRVDEAGAADVVLLSGAISVQSAVNTDPIDVVQPGWGLNIAAGGAAGDPVLFSAEQIDNIVSSVEFSTGAGAGQEDGADDAGSSDTESNEASEEEGGETTVAEAPAIALSDVTEITQVADALAAELTVDSSGSYSTNDIIGLLLANDNLADLFGDIGDIEDAALSNVSVEAQLLQFLVTGGQPLWLQVGNDGSLGNTLPTDDSLTLRGDANLAAQNGYASVDDVPTLLMLAGPGNVFNYDNAINGPLLSATYSGSARYVKNDLALTPDPDSPVGGSGRASYDVTLNYGNAAITGSMTINDLVINSIAYIDKTAQITNPTIEGQALSVSDTLSGVQLLRTGMDPVDSNDIGAGIALHADFGSIVDFSTSPSGTSSIDGALGGFRVEAYATNDPLAETTSMLRAEQFQVGEVSP